MHTSTQWLIGEIAFLATASTLLGAMGFPLFLPYDWYLLLHILGVVLFMGNIIVTGVWMALSERTMEPKVLQFSTAVANWADVAFTAPGVILIVLSGLTLANRWGGLFATNWITAGAILFAASGFVWAVFLIPSQDKMIRLASSPSEGQLSPQFFRVLHRWYFWGAVATILPLATTILIVVKPPV